MASKGPDGYLFIQGDDPNVWLGGQSWQKDFLSEDLSELTKSMFTRNRNYTYLNIPVTNADDLGCPVLKDCFKNSGLKDVPKFNGGTNYFSLVSTWFSSEHPVKRAGFLCNLSTGSCRMYVISSLNSVNVTHTGPVVMTEDLMKEYQAKIIKQ